MPAPPGTRRSNSATSSATATRRSSVIAPTGTIGLVMDCDTTGIEPDFALVKFKKLAGGGYFKIINRAVPEALRTLGYSESRDRRDRGLCRRPRHALQRARDQLRIAKDPRLRRCDDQGHRVEARDRLRHQVRVQPLDARRRGAEEARRHRRAARQPAIRSPRAPRLRQARGRGREPARLRRDDARRRALPQGRAPAGVRLRQSLRPDRQALSLGREPHPHDGGGAAVHLRRDLEDHQHAERRDGGGLQGELHAFVAAWRSKPTRSIATARSSRSPCPRS